MVLAVGLGAFGSHALKAKLSEYSLDVYKTAVLYHMIHALGLFAVAWLSSTAVDPKINLAGIFMLAGIILFSGSLYVVSVTGIKSFGAVTPIGGVCLLAAWTLLLVSKF
jgi:uncharacterized membrane protein YgdD (TMEM256/DUF423 family)